MILPAAHPIRTELQENIFHAGPVAIHYAEGPQTGPPLVLLHGVGRNWQDFLPLIPAFAAKWHVLALDLRGHGKSGRVPQGYKSGNYAGDVTAFLQSIVHGPAVLFGHSLGGVITMRIAAHHPDLVRAAILGDSVLSAEGLAGSMYQPLFAGLYQVLIHGGAAHDIARRLAKIQIRVPGIAELVAIQDLPGNDAAALLKWADCLRQVDPEVMLMTRDGLSLADFDGRSLLPRMQCPTLILQANPDLGGLVPQSDIDAAMRLLPSCQIARFPLLGHALHLQRPQPVTDAVLKFLNGLTQA